ncbi:MAG: hypothetical protein ACRDRH_07480 [Pseudonocardia sp.]
MTEIGPSPTSTPDKSGTMIMLGLECASLAVHTLPLRTSCHPR